LAQLVRALKVWDRLIKAAALEMTVAERKMSREEVKWAPGTLGDLEGCPRLGNTLFELAQVAEHQTQPSPSGDYPFQFLIVAQFEALGQAGRGLTIPANALEDLSEPSLYDRLPTAILAVLCECQRALPCCDRSLRFTRGEKVEYRVGVDRPEPGPIVDAHC